MSVLPFLLSLAGRWACLSLCCQLWGMVPCRRLRWADALGFYSVWTLSLSHELLHCPASSLSLLFLFFGVSSFLCLVWYSFMNDVLLFLSWSKMHGLCESSLSLRSLFFFNFQIDSCFPDVNIIRSLTSTWYIFSEGPSRSIKGI